MAAVEGFASGPSPAQLAGLKAGDRIAAVNGRHFRGWEQLTAYLRARPGQRVALTIERAGHTFVTSVVLANGAKVRLKGQKAALDRKPTGLLGIEIQPSPVRFGLWGSVEHAGTAFGSTAVTSVSGLGRVVSDFGGYTHMLANQKAADSPTAERFVSPVGVVRLANQATKIGLSEVLYLLILINIFVGIFNMLPLLPFDGGHVAIAIYEKLRSLRFKTPLSRRCQQIGPGAVRGARRAGLLRHILAVLGPEGRAVLSLRRRR